MIRIVDDIDKERDRIQACIGKYGWTSDHNLDWWSMCAYKASGKSVFVEFDDGSGLLTYRYPDEWSIWSDPLSDKNLAVDRINKFASLVLDNQIKKVWCIDVSENIRSELTKKSFLGVGDIYYSLFWPVLNVNKYKPMLSGNHFKEMRNARNKFYRERKVEVKNTNKVDKTDLLKIIDSWKNNLIKKGRINIEDIYDLKYQRAVANNFKGFLTSRVFLVDGRPVGFNAGYEVVNSPERFAGVIGIHDYSLKDLGTILWLEDLEWVKNHGYKELDMQGSEDDDGLKLKLSFGAKIERKTNTFLIKK